MYFAYFDESGDSGRRNSPTNWFVLNALLVHDSVWLDTYNELGALRRDLYRRYRIPAHYELKGSDFLGGGGAFRGLEIRLGQRMEIFRQILEAEAGMLLSTFSVAVGKAASGDAREYAWTLALEQLENYCEREGEMATLYPDEGHGQFIERMVRRMRRSHKTPALGGNSLVNNKLERILEAPNNRKSQESYFIQLADLNAYATHRHRAIAPMRRVPADLWDALGLHSGDVRVGAVNASNDGPRGVMVRYT